MNWVEIATIVLSVLAVATSIWFFIDGRKMLRQINEILDEWEKGIK